MASSFSLVTRTTVPAQRLFDVCLSIDEHVASMDQSGEQAVGGVTTGTIGLDETVTWRARHFGIWFTMTSRITALERPDRFVDEQVRGPFRSFHHEHSFTRDGETTVMVDTLTLASPVFGRLAERLVLVPYLRRLIRRRNHHLLEALGAARGTDPGSPSWADDPSSPFRRSEASALIGRGDEVWRRASRDVLRWAVKTRSGFTVDDARPVTRGAESTVTARVVGVTVREPVQVVDVVETSSRVGFSYRTLPGHPVDGEEAFIVHRDGDDVFLTVRSLTAPAPGGPWRALYPALRIAQIVARRRYLRALG
ncbi:uncharacterized protein (UPF0548 family)/ligand-binding SRPBCC domain-containing protein [Agromyces terreus]|uniref:Uncharacterized protein (UPF0548 family)/ligand-binding SRPBCC domain-containing protein n=1 Tax=Agromyces terreus TaxID=424795 RepID=A0A9X2KAT4_9MICO|nr:DUF1990 family protein [Agromyces terreus]MCP2369909.1 uncharacterized protein (UPF0548 family)/ligand-binding SRPBCC domain-containing protein [Agromyces terreus]